MIFSILHRMMQHDDGVVNDNGNQHISFFNSVIMHAYYHSASLQH